MVKETGEMVNRVIKRIELQGDYVEKFLKITKKIVFLSLFKDLLTPSPS